MKILVVGGTGFVGPNVVKRLVEAGHEVSVFHRGRTEADLPAGVERVLGDRERLEDSAGEFARFAPEVVVDVTPMLEGHARAVMETFRGLAGRVVAVSSGNVYRAYGRLTGVEPGPPDRVPLREDAPLREKFFPYRGEEPRAADVLASFGDPEEWAACRRLEAAVEGRQAVVNRLQHRRVIAPRHALLSPHPPLCTKKPT